MNSGLSTDGRNESQSVPFATVMNDCQICAGNVPPATLIPCTLRISTSAFGYPTQTDAARCGV